MNMSFQKINIEKTYITLSTAKEIIIVRDQLSSIIHIQFYGL